MKQLVFAAAASLVLVLSGVLPAFAEQATTGNGAPSGAHFNVNLIGMAKEKTADLTGDNGRRIFVKLDGRTNIYLQEGAFEVVDADGTDGSASFRLPDPADDADADNMLEYSVYIRALTPGSADMRTCFTDGSGTWCNAGDLIVSLNKVAPPKFANVTKQLLQVCVDTDPTAIVDLELVPLFSDGILNQWWQYDNDGLRLAQMRFYPGLQTTPQGGACTRTAG